MDDYTLEYIKKAFFEEGEFEIMASNTYNDVSLGHSWDDPKNLGRARVYDPNDGWIWDGDSSAVGITWGGCLESIDEMLRHNIQIPTLDDFKDITLLLETSEEIPSADYVFRVLRALGERGILERIQAILVGRPKAWEFDKQLDSEQRRIYKVAQREAISRAVRQYNKTVPVIQNIDFGHTDPQIPFPFGKIVRIDSTQKKIRVEF